MQTLFCLVHGMGCLVPSSHVSSVFVWLSMTMDCCYVFNSLVSETYAGAHKASSGSSSSTGLHGNLAPVADIYLPQLNANGELTDCCHTRTAAVLAL
jgi:hypothetical protein